MGKSADAFVVVLRTMVIVMMASTVAFAQSIPWGAKQDLDSMIRSSESVINILEKSDLWVGGAVGSYSQGLESIKLYGSETPNGNVSIPSDSAFEIGSISKSFTGIILAVALEEFDGMSVDDPIGKFLPEAAGNHYVSSITFRQLATHSAGLPDAPTNLFNSSGFDIANPYVNYSESQLLDFLKGVSPDPRLVDAKNPGKYLRSYSNVGFATLGLVLTRMYGMTFDELIQLKITQRLGMTHTFVNRKNSTLPRHMMNGYDVTRNPSKPWEWDVMAPAGGIISTSDDMMKYLRANVRSGDGALARAISLSHELGLGWDSYPGDGIVMKNGQVAGFASLIAFDVKHTMGVFVLSNIGSVLSDQVAAEAIEQWNQFPASQIYKLFPAPLTEKIIPSPAILQKAPGAYQTTDGSPDVTLKTVDHSIVLSDQRTADVLLANRKIQGQYVVYDGITSEGLISFNEDASGRISGFTLTTVDPKDPGNPQLRLFTRKN